MKHFNHIRFLWVFVLTISVTCCDAQSTFQYDLNGNVTNVCATIPGPPTIAASPTNENVFYGQDTSLSVDASGAGPLGYQWYKNGAVISGATNSTLFLSEVKNGGSYTVVVSNGFGSTTSAVPAEVTAGEFWVGGDYGNDWFDSFNWNPPRVPAGNENIIIPASSETVNLSSPVTITGTVNWDGGTIIGSLTVASNGVMNISGNVAFYGGWTNNGTMNADNVNFVGGTITLNNSGTFNNSGDPVTITGTLTNSTLYLSATSGSWVMNGGTLRNTVLTESGGAELQFGTGTLDGVTVNGILDVGNLNSGAALTVLNGLTLNGTLLLGNPTNQSYGQVYFDGSQTLGGNGTVEFGNQQNGNCFHNALLVNSSGGTLTIGPGMTIRGQNGSIGYTPCYGGYANASVVNQGTVLSEGGGIAIYAQDFTNEASVRVTNGASLYINTLQNAASGKVLVNTGTLTLDGSGWSNAGIINETSNSVANFDGSFSLAGLGMFNRSGGSLNLYGTMDNGGGSMALNPSTGGLFMNGGTLRNTVLTESGGAELQFGNGTLDGVTVNSILDVGNLNSGASLTVLNGLTLNGTLLLGNPTNQSYGQVYFDGSQTLGGNGTVEFGNQQNGNCFHNALLVNSSGGTLTIGPGMTIRGQNGSIGYTPCYGGYGNASVVNQGTILSEGGGIAIYAQDFTNQGTIDASIGTVNVVGSYNLIGGTLGFGLSSPSAFGKINFSGNVPLTGTVEATLLDGFIPGVSNSFPVLSYGSESGIFDGANLPLGFVWQTNYGPTTFTLTVSAPNPVLQALANPAAPFLLQFTAPTNTHYTVLASTNIATPLSNWPNIGSPSLLSNNLYQFTDTQSVGFPARFYILRSP